MDNPAFLPSLILIGGFAWNFALAAIAGVFSRDEGKPRQFWVRQIGWTGMGGASIVAAAVFVADMIGRLS